MGKPSTIPVVGLTHELGAALVKDAKKDAKKSGLKLRVKTDTVHGKKSSANVIADTERGDPGNVVLVGAHLDSAPAGAGINDNGTGAAALLAIAGKIKDLGKGGLRNRVRFAWWGAEEEGRAARPTTWSRCRGPAGEDRLNINLDMLGSPNGTRGVYDGDHSTGGGTRAPAGSGAIEKMFRDYFKGRHLPTSESEFNGRSDYGPFIERASRPAASPPVRRV